MTPGRHVAMIVSNPCTHDPRVLQEASSLVQAGYDVTVIAWDRQETHDLRTDLENIQVRRVRLHGPSRRLPLDVLRLGSWWRAARDALLTLHGQTPIDVIHAHDLDTLPAGVPAARRLGVPLVYDSHEIWPAMIRKDLPAIVSWWFARLERRLIPSTTATVAASEPVRDHLVSQGAIEPTVVMNAKPAVAATPPGGRGGALSALYVGGLQPVRFLHGLITAAAGLEGVRLRIIGPGRKRYVRRLERAVATIDNVTVEAPIPMDQVIRTTAASDLVVCPFDPTDPLTRIGLPNKLFEAMATARPILTSKGTWVGETAKRLGVGRAVPHTVEGFREGLAWYRDHREALQTQGRQGHRLSQGAWGWDAQERRLLDLYSYILQL